MSNEIIQLLVNSSGAALVAGMFLFYLGKRDKVLDSNLKDSNSSNRELAKQIERFSNVIGEQKEILKEQSNILKSLYEENYKKMKRIKILEGSQ